MKRKGILGILPFLLSVSGWSLTVDEAYRTVVDTNPEVRQRIEHYRSVDEDKTIARADYLPVLDVEGGIGYKNSDYDFIADDVDYQYTEAFIRARQNLFRGFGTMNDVEQQEARLSSAEYYLMEKVSQIGLDVIESYLNILREKQLYALTEDNLETHKRIYAMIKERTDSGAGSQADYEQISGRLALAESNMKVATNNMEDAQSNFKRIYGESVEPDALMEADVNASLIPGTFEEAEALALRQYPSLMATRKNIESSQAAYRQAKENYYPWVDLEVMQTYQNAEDVSLDNVDGYHRDEFSVMLIASWNLYNGGADMAKRDKELSNIFRNSETLSNDKRKVIERLELSWAARKRISEQSDYLKQHRDFTQKTLEAYNEEFRLGRRTLLDVLDVENEFYTSRKAYATSHYAHQLAEYRIIENVGNLPAMVAATSEHVLELERNEVQSTEPEPDTQPASEKKE